jgi:DNA polymerase
MVEAVEFPGRETGYRDIGFEIVDDWLTMILPNGKRLWYREPELQAKMPQWHQPETKEECADGSCDCEPRMQVSYMAYKNSKWKRVFTYGGKIMENATQAACREILVPAINRLEKYGYNVILKIYDEAVCEIPENFGSKEEFKEILLEPQPWFEHWPINADVWTGPRFKK